MRILTSHSVSLLIFIASLTSNAGARSLPAKPHNNHVYRAASRFGGFALTADRCPRDANVCGVGGCCPNGSVCHTSKDEGESPYCCPTENDCHPVITAIPTCADPSWLLYTTSTNGYLCCGPDETAILPDENNGGTGYGRCVPADPPAASFTTRPSQTTLSMSTSSPTTSVQTSSFSSSSSTSTSAPTPSSSSASSNTTPKIPKPPHHHFTHLDHTGGFTLPAIFGILGGTLFLLTGSLCIGIFMRREKKRKYQCMVEQGTRSKNSPTVTRVEKEKSGGWAGGGGGVDKDRGGSSAGSASGGSVVVNVTREVRVMSMRSDGTIGTMGSGGGSGLGILREPDGVMTPGGRHVRFAG